MKPSQTGSDETNPPVHDASLKEGVDYTLDSSGFFVWTRGFLERRGECCGSACRNCPYEHENVPKNEQEPETP